MSKDLIKNIIRETLHESKVFQIIENRIQSDEDDLNEERIANTKAKHFVKKRKNFIGSHIFGEDLGNLGKMYVAYSYGEQFPAYLWHGGKWYHNYDKYILPDGTENKATEKHKNNMLPQKGTIGISTKQLKSLISNFKKEHGLEELKHTSVKPGEKN
jgi:hypothetical protein